MFYHLKDSADIEDCFHKPTTTPGDSQQQEPGPRLRTSTTRCDVNPILWRPMLGGSLGGVFSEFRIATKSPLNWSAGLIFGATGTAGRAPSF